MADIGYPIAEVSADGGMVIGKPAGTGGRVDRLTVIEQMLYEMHDPAAYLAPDVVLDVTDVTVEQAGADRVRVSGARGRPAPETLKATVCIDGGVLGEAEISYAGPNAAARARLAAETIAARMRRRAPGLKFRTDTIGVVSVLGDDGGTFAHGHNAAPADVRLRFAAQSSDAAAVELLLDEVEALYCAGPAGGAASAAACCRGSPAPPAWSSVRFVRPSVTMLGGGA